MKRYGTTCEFTGSFLEHARQDLEVSSINREALTKVRGLQHLLAPGSAKERFEREDRRITWALLASLNSFVSLSKDPYRPAGSLDHVDLKTACAEVARFLAQNSRRLVIDLSEVTILDVRDERLVTRREREGELKQIGRIEQLIICAQNKNYRCAGIAFYDFVYRLCADVERVPAWAQCLTEIE